MTPAVSPRRPRLRRFALAASIALIAASASAAEPQGPARPDAPPIWTTVPTRIDRSRETRERLAPAPTAVPSNATRITAARADDATALTIDGRRHRLVGLAVADRRRICTADDGARWACGRRAHAALSALVVGRTLWCVTPGDPSAAEPRVDCRTSDGPSLSERMVAAGWAELDAAGEATPALLAARDDARRARRGLWSTDAPP